MPMRQSHILSAILTSILGHTVSAAPTITLLGDSGALRVTTYSPTLQVASSNLGPVYGTSPVPPVVTTSAGGVVAWKISFIPKFPVLRHGCQLSGGGAMTMETDGKLDFIFTLDSPLVLTGGIQILEDGVFKTTGSGAKDVKGGFVVTNLSTQTTAGNSFPSATFLNTGPLDTQRYPKRPGGARLLLLQNLHRQHPLRRSPRQCLLWQFRLHRQKRHNHHHPRPPPRTLLPRSPFHRLRRPPPPLPSSRTCRYISSSAVNVPVAFPTVLYVTVPVSSPCSSTPAYVTV